VGYSCDAPTGAFCLSQHIIVQGLEVGVGGAAVHLVGFVAVALTAELGSLVGGGASVVGIVGSAEEEHGGVVTGRQARVGVLRDGDDVHHVGLVAGGANDHRLIIGRRRVLRRSRSSKRSGWILHPAWRRRH